MATDNVWSNPGGTPGQQVALIRRDSEAWRELAAALDQDASHIRIWADGGTFKVKVGEGMWSWPLDVGGDPTSQG